MAFVKLFYYFGDHVGTLNLLRNSDFSLVYENKRKKLDYEKLLKFWAFKGFSNLFLHD